MLDFAIADAGFEIRKSQPDDAAPCRMLLPHFDPQGQFWVAVSCAHNLVVGAAGATKSRRMTPRVGPGVDVHVIAPCRGHGIARQLTATLLQSLASQGAEAVYTTHKVDESSEAFRAWERLGFSVCETVEEHLLPLAEIEPLLSPMVEWMRRRGDIPSSAEICPLFRADLHAVLQLHLDQLGSDRSALWPKLHGEGPGGFHPKYSCVLKLTGRTIGCLLAHRRSATHAVVDAVIVEPEFRLGWANALLKLSATRSAKALGITHFVFTTFDHYSDTRRFAARLGGVVTRRLALMTHPLVNRDPTTAPCSPSHGG